MANRNSLTPKTLRKALHYDPLTGVFVWRIAPNGRVPAGSIAGHIHPNQYRYIGLGGHIYRAHRLAWLYMTGHWPASQIDHRNLDKSDNRFANLRPASVAENAQHRGPRKDSKSGIKGVGWHKASKKWTARIQSNGERLQLGLFDTDIEAAEAYALAAVVLHLGFARI